MSLFAGTQFYQEPKCDRCGLLDADCQCAPVEPERKLVDPNKQTARIRKEKRAKIGLLIKSNIMNDEAAEHRYNFVVGSSVKYLFVTEAQQEQLAKGELAIVFLGEKRCLIPAEIGKEIKVIEQSRLVIFCEPESDA